MVVPFLTFSKTSVLFFKVAALFYIPNNNIQVFYSLVTTLSDDNLFVCFYNIAMLTGMNIVFLMIRFFVVFCNIPLVGSFCAQSYLSTWGIVFIFHSHPSVYLPLPGKLWWHRPKVSQSRAIT